jgi:cation diffusion facilitator CzcD-associated flavoprotein CzcO
LEKVSKTGVAIIGAGPYGLSLAAHLGEKGIEHRIFGRPMEFWAKVAQAADQRYLKSFCFATNLSTPKPGFSFADYNRPRGLETFEPCSMGNFAAYGEWFQQANVPWVEPHDVTHLQREHAGFAITLTNGERVYADRAVLATGLAYFASSPSVLSALPSSVATHTSQISSFSIFEGKRVAIVGAGQSALEAAALLHEAGARPQLFVRENQVLWHTRIPQERSLLRRLRSPLSGLGVGPKAWALINFPGLLHQLPTELRTNLVKNHLPPEGAWWLRERVEGRVPVHTGTSIVRAQEAGGRVTLTLNGTTDGNEKQVEVDHVVAGSGYSIDVERLSLLDAKLRKSIAKLQRAPRLNAQFESSIPGLHFIGPTSAMSFGPLFRFVVGADYTARVVSNHLASSRALSAA